MAAELIPFEIRDPTDARLSDWLDLYETSFPFGERMLVSTVLKELDKINRGENINLHYLVFLDKEQKCLGMMLHDAIPDEGVAMLWYMAIKPSERGKGLGSFIYQDLLARLDPSIYKALIFEVEIPGEEDGEQARRRIQFYKRHGAFLLDGIQYYQHIGWHHEPTQMYLMVHPIRPLTAEQAFDLAKIVFEENVRQCGVLLLR